MLLACACTASRTFEGDTTRLERASAMQGVAVLDSVRAASHDGFDRMVFYFRGAELPGYVVEYRTDEPTHCASGAPIALNGAARLHVRLSPTQAHAPVDGDERPTIVNRALEPRLPQLRSLAMDCDFEGVVGWTAGLAARRPFRVQTMMSPPRLVIDLQTN